jgi:hypothetical protein
MLLSFFLLIVSIILFYLFIYWRILFYFFIYVFLIVRHSSRCHDSLEHVTQQALWGLGVMSHLLRALPRVELFLADSTLPHVQSEIPFFLLGVFLLWVRCVDFSLSSMSGFARRIRTSVLFAVLRSVGFVYSFFALVLILTFRIIRLCDFGLQEFSVSILTFTFPVDEPSMSNCSLVFLCWYWWSTSFSRKSYVVFWWRLTRCANK